MASFLVSRERPKRCDRQDLTWRLLGALYYLSTWYKKDETSLRTSLFFYGQMFASATSSLISAGLLRLSGSHGLEGWRWIFLGRLTLSALCVLPLPLLRETLLTFH